MRRLLVSVVALAAVGVVAASGSDSNASEGAARWVVRDLGPCPFYNCWSTMEINERGRVVGTSGRTAFLWQNGKRISLGTLRGHSASEGMAINERGQVVGSSGPLTGNGRAFLWENGRMRDLGVLPGTTASTAVAINDAGQIAGYDWTMRGQFDLPSSAAFMWEKGRMLALPTLPGDAESEAIGMNADGWIIGSSSPGTHGGGSEAVVWRDGKITGLGRLVPLGWEAIDINDRGQIVGSAFEPSRLLLWEKGATRVIGRQWTNDLAIDEHGRVIGSIGSLSDRVFVWEKGQLRFLGPGQFQAVNERGQILAWTAGKPRLWEKGKWVTLPLLRGHKYGMALALNERDQVVGWSGNYDFAAKEDDVYKGRIVLWTLKR